MPSDHSLEHLENSAEFIHRHIGPSREESADMLEFLQVENLDALIKQTVPVSIRSDTTQGLEDSCTEHQALAELKNIACKNKIYRSFLGLGYHDTYVPPVILRNVLENPGWYTAYTPYQPEIAQGRLEGLLNFQQMVIELTGMEMANASMLDEATSAAEAMSMAKRCGRKNRSNVFLLDENCYPQTKEVVKTRAHYFGFEIKEGNIATLASQEHFGALIQYPGSEGEVFDLAPLINQIHSKDALAIVAADIMSLVLLQAPGEVGADIVVGSNQRFGIPMGFGGPHAAFFAFKEAYKRSTPGRIIGLSVDSRGKPALRMAMQTREQHIRREKANSNICTSQVLLALMSAFYAMYHGPKGIKNIALRIHTLSRMLASGLHELGFSLRYPYFFDTLCVEVGNKQEQIYSAALNNHINLRKVGRDALAISFNECSSSNDLCDLLEIFSIKSAYHPKLDKLEEEAKSCFVLPEQLLRKNAALQHPVFSLYHSETEMLRYLKRLESRDIALNHAMIPLGSCTMKLNATAEMIPVTWSEFSRIHPFAPSDQTQGYQLLFQQLDHMLQACTGYDAFSLQPNAGSQGEYAGLVCIRRYFESKQENQRQICLIPSSAHGTNPASAQMVGMKVVVTACDSAGNVDINDLRKKVEQYGTQIAALMITYPSTHGVFEEEIVTICDLIHSVGAQVYIDGANMNALVGLASPGQFGGDVSHLNLHKTFCIPHGGGGPGMGPIGVKKHLAPFLPSHPEVAPANTKLINGTISAAPWGSASILPISWMYVRMMGRQGMRLASQYAILNANYIAKRLEAHYPILYRGKAGRIAHECLLDLRPIKENSGVSEEDIAKRLMDFGFHAPTMSFPVAGTLMIEPTESESQQELDRFCEAMIQIRLEINKIESGLWPRSNNPLVNAPHTLDDVMDDWDRPYTREEATRPLVWLKSHKVWPSVNRIDNVYGDRNLVCSCPSIESYVQEA